MPEITERSTIVPVRCPACAVSQRVTVNGDSTDGLKYSGVAKAHCRACQQTMTVRANWTVEQGNDH